MVVSLKWFSPLLSSLTPVQIPHATATLRKHQTEWNDWNGSREAHQNKEGVVFLLSGQNVYLLIASWLLETEAGHLITHFFMVHCINCHTPPLYSIQYKYTICILVHVSEKAPTGEITHSQTKSGIWSLTPDHLCSPSDGVGQPHIDCHYQSNTDAHIWHTDR